MAAAAVGAKAEYTIDEAIEAIGFGRYQLAVLLMSGLCWTADAMEMLLLSYIKLPLQCEWKISDAQAAIITAGVGAGMLFGSVTWGVVSDGYGRRVGFLAVAAFTFSFGVVSALSTNYTMMVASRTLVGFGIGGVPVAFSLMMEWLPVAQRGTWGMGVVLFWSGGAIFEALIAMEIMPTLGWRWLVAISSAPLGMLLLLWPALPESPRWLVGKGKIEEAQKLLEAAAKVNGVTLPQGTLSSKFDAVDDGHGSVGADQIRLLLHPTLRAMTLRIWYLWFSAAFVYYGLVMLQPDMIAMENKGLRCEYHIEGGQSIPQHHELTSDPAKDASSNNSSSISSSSSSSVEPGDTPCLNAMTVSDYVDSLISTAGEFPGVIATMILLDHLGRRPSLAYMYHLR